MKRKPLIHSDDKSQTLKLIHHGKFYSFLLEKLRHQLNETIKNNTKKSHKTHKPKTNFSFLLLFFFLFCGRNHFLIVVNH